MCAKESGDGHPKMRIPERKFSRVSGVFKSEPKLRWAVFGMRSQVARLEAGSWGLCVYVCVWGGCMHMHTHMYIYVCTKMSEYKYSQALILKYLQQLF